MSSIKTSFGQQHLDLPAIHDWHLKEVLRDLGILEEIQAGQATCNTCKKKVTLENLSAIKLGPKQTILLICDSIECLGTAWAGEARR